MVRVHIQSPRTFPKHLTFRRTLSRRLRRLRRPRRGEASLLPRLLLGLPHPTNPPRLPGRRALAPELLHLGGEHRQRRDPREAPRRCGPARGRQQGVLLHQGEALLLQQQVPQIHPPRRNRRVYSDRILPGLLGWDLRPLPTTPAYRELQEGLPAEFYGEIFDLYGLEEMRAVWENRRESGGLQPHSVSILIKWLERRFPQARKTENLEANKLCHQLHLRRRILLRLRRALAPLRLPPVRQLHTGARDRGRRERVAPDPAGAALLRQGVSRQHLPAPDLLLCQVRTPVREVWGVLVPVPRLWEAPLQELCRPVRRRRPVPQPGLERGAG